MAGLSFRPRPIDITRPIKVVDDAPEDGVAMRSVPAMPTGMEREEELETHIKKLVRQPGLANTLGIPIPAIKVVEGYDHEQYKPFERPQSYIYYEEKTESDLEDVVEYDMDHHDTEWTNLWNAKVQKNLQVDPDTFEYALDVFEKEGYKQGEAFTASVALSALSTLPIELVTAMYTYWRKKRTDLCKGDFLTGRYKKPPAINDTSPLIAFRPRDEEFLLRPKKPRKPTHDPSLMKKLKQLRSDMVSLREICDVVKQREQCKKDHLQAADKVLTHQEEQKRYMAPVFSPYESYETDRYYEDGHEQHDQQQFVPPTINKKQHSPKASRRRSLHDKMHSSQEDYISTSTNSSFTRTRGRVLDFKSMEEDSADSLYNPSSSEGEEPSPFQSEQMHEYFVGTRNQLVTCIHRTLPELNPFPSEDTCTPMEQDSSTYLEDDETTEKESSEAAESTVLVENPEVPIAAGAFRMGERFIHGRMRRGRGGRLIFDPCPHSNTRSAPCIHRLCCRNCFHSAFGPPQHCSGCYYFQKRLKQASQQNTTAVL